jgi:RNA polymerase sigma factor (sigma-70 family)
VSEIMTNRERSSGLVAEFERVYRAHVGEVTAYFARRSAEPQTVADLTADTFVRAITSFATFDPARGSPRGWLYGIARRVFAQHCERISRGRDVMARLGGRRELAGDEVAELVTRVDAERAGRELLAAMAELTPTDRDVLELVDVAGLDRGDAAAALGLSLGAMRIRLFRARGRLRKIVGENHG